MMLLREWLNICTINTRRELPDNGVSRFAHLHKLHVLFPVLPSQFCFSIICHQCPDSAFLAFARARAEQDIRTWRYPCAYQREERSERRTMSRHVAPTTRTIRSIRKASAGDIFCASSPSICLVFVLCLFNGQSV